MPQLEGDEEEGNEGKWLNILTPKKLLTRLSTLLAQIKAGNNWQNKKMTSDKYYIFCITKRL